MLILIYYAFILLGIGAAALFQLLFLKSKRPLLLACSILWLLPICYEIWVLNTCTGECNIRADLVFVFPAEVVVLTIVTLLSWKVFKQPTKPHVSR
jgi:hypothetical protein